VTLALGLPNGPRRHAALVMGTHEPTDSVDEGTATGAPTMLLTRLLAGVFGAARAAADWFGRLHNLLATASSAIRRRVQAGVAAIRTAMRAAGGRLSIVLQRALAVVARHGGGVALVLVGAAAGLRLVVDEPAGVALTYPVAPTAADTIRHSGALWIALPLGVIHGARMVHRAWGSTLRSWIDRLGGAIWSISRRVGRRVWSWLTHASQLVHRASRHVVQTLRALLRHLATPTRRLTHLVTSAIGRTLAHVMQTLRRIAGAIWSISRRVGRRVWSWLTHASQLVHRASSHVVQTLRALLRHLATPARRLTHLVASALGRVVCGVASVRDRVTLSTGVAIARARMTTVGVAAVTVEQERSSVRRRDVTSGFTAAMYQNEYLPAGAREAHAIITVTSVVERDEGSPDSAVVILLDCSGSMGRPWSKLQAARRATAAAIDALAEGTWFAIVRGNDRAEVAYPPSGEVIRSTSETRAAAKRAVRLLWPEGGTAMGRWLSAADALFAGSPGAVNRAILLTDGRNESESARALDDVLRACAGRFQCDCRGVGADWSVDELRMIANGLLGTIDVVPEPDLLTTDFQAMATAAMARGVGEVRLDVQAPSGGSLLHLSQATPEWIPLPLARADDGVYRCSTGAWGVETRDFHLNLALPAGEVGDEMLAAKVSVVVDGEVAAQLQVKAIWCDDERQSTAMHPAVAHYETQAQIVASIGRGLGAQGTGDAATAARELGRAAQLADAIDHAATLRLLEAVVDVEDAPTGVVRIKSDVDPLEAMTLDARSTRTSAWRADRAPDVPTEGAGSP
jgi:von Willebrand factor type A C-terminal domain/von Willebrand factor type A domain